MTITNGYCNLTDFRRQITASAQILNEDEADDDVIESLIEAASRRVDELTGRIFYPFIQTRHYDIPYDNNLWFDADLLEVTTLTNGDNNTIASTDYVLKPNNSYPKYMLGLRGVSSVTWEYDSTSSGEQVIDVLGVWGYHEQYDTRAWKSVGTLGAAWASTSTLTATLTAGHTLDFRGGEIIKIDSEITNTASTSSTGLVVQARGDNGSTAATHLISSVVYVWQPTKEIKQLTMEVAKIMYRSRYGESIDTVATYTPSGVIVTPRSLPVWANEVINSKRRLV